MLVKFYNLLYQLQGLNKYEIGMAIGARALLLLMAPYIDKGYKMLKERLR